MTGDHPDPGLLERFMRNETEGEELRHVVRHLLTGCGSCVEVTRRFWRLGEGGAIPTGPTDRAQVPRINPLKVAERKELRARRLAVRGDSEEAEILLDRSFALYRALGKRHLEARVLIQKGTIRGWSPEPEAMAQGIRWLEEGIALLEETSSEPALKAFGLHRLALLLADAGRPEASGFICRARALYEALEDGPNLVRLRHLEGRIADARGDAETAEAAFLEARRGFVLAGLGGEAAEVLFDLAIFYTRHGRTPEIRRLAMDLLPILQTQDIRQGVGLALLYFRRLVETEQATLDVLSEVARYVASLPRERRPALR